jgi:hypothetical protein
LLLPKMPNSRPVKTSSISWKKISLDYLSDCCILESHSLVST